MLTLRILLVLFMSSLARSLSNDGRIQRFAVFDNFVAIARSDSIGVYRHNGTNIDFSTSRYEIPLSNSSLESADRLLHLKIVTKAKLTYCGEDACWLCALKSTGTHHCQGYYVSRSGRKMASAECVLGDAYLTVRFVDTKGNASTVKFAISEEENTGPIYPRQQADDMEETRIRNQALLTSFRDNSFTYFVGSSERINEPACIISNTSNVCATFEKSVRVMRICDFDETEHLESKVEVSLECGGVHEYVAWDTAVAATYNGERDGFLSVVFASTASNVASVCDFLLRDLARHSKATWDVCQKVTSNNRQTCREYAAYGECKISTKNLAGTFSLCNRYSTNISSSSIEICSLQEYKKKYSLGDTHFWLENFQPFHGALQLSLNLYQNQLVSFIYHVRSESYFTLSKTAGGSSRIDRVISGANKAGRSVWNVAGVDAVTVQYNHLFRAVFFIRNDSVEAQPVACEALYKSCGDVPPRSAEDHLNCVWCQLGDEGFSRSASCPEPSLSVDTCQGSHSPVADPVVVVLSVTTALVLLIAVAYFVWRYKKKRGERKVEDIDRYPFAHASVFPQLYEACSAAYFAYRNLFESTNKQIDYNDLVTEFPPIGEGRYGQVYKGTYKKDGREITVACKTVNDLRSTCTGDFLREARAMSILDHPRVLEFVGICFDTEGYCRPTILVTKYMSHGDLCQYLRNKKNMITLGQLLGFGLEVAEGMEYIHSKNVIHRDLASRNCMLDDALHVCVADFGLSRFANEEEAGYQVRTSRPLPLSTLSIEALAEGHFSTKSDVWAFGNLLWELMTRGFPPWKGVSQEDLLLRLRRGERLPLQEYWPSLIYHRLMLPCWEESPEGRPTSSEILAEMGSVLEELKGRQQALIDTNYEVPNFKNAGRIQRFDALGDLVAIARSDSIGVYRHNGTNIDFSTSRYEIPLSNSSLESADRLLHLKIVTKAKLTYCGEDACWLCSLKPNGTHHCQGYYVSRSGRKMASVECVLGDAYLTVRFVDTKGNASTVKFAISEEENTGPIYPRQQADDMEGTRIRNQALLTSFRDNSFTYFVVSADRIDEPACLTTSRPNACTDFKKSVRIARVCDDDQTELLESKVEISLTCDSRYHDTVVWDTVLAAHYREYKAAVTVVVGSSSSDSAWICTYQLDDIVNLFERVWNICQNVTTSDREKCRNSISLECRITSRNSSGDYALCRKYVDSATYPSEVCTLKQFESYSNRRYWLEVFAPLLGDLMMSLHLNGSKLISIINHKATRSMFMLLRASNGSSAVERIMGDEFGDLGDPTYSSVVWSAARVDAVPLVFDSSSNAIFYCRSDSVEIQPITCNSLYKACTQIPSTKERDPLKCEWCQLSETKGFSRPKKSNEPGLSCPDSNIFVDKCPEDSKNAAQPAEEGPAIKIAISVGGTAAIVVLLVMAYFLWRWKKKPHAEAIEDRNYPGCLVDQSLPYETFGGAYSDAYRLLFESSDKRINYDDLVMESNPIGEGRYGQVYRGIYKSRGGQTIVACKTISDWSASGTEDFLREARAMSVLDHPRVLEFIGICFDRELPSRPTVLVTRYMIHGDLCQYVKDTNNLITLGQLLGFGLEVAEGMEYIHSKNVIHRDLASRNCMLDDDLHVCVADFGLSRFANEEEAGYQVRNSRPLPLSTLSIEALAEGHFSTKSDVWAFGNLLWELMTRGFPPWKGVSQEDLLLRLRRGERLPLQEYWPSLIYHRLMLPCWEESPEDRPTSSEILAEMGSVLEELKGRQQALIDTNYEVPNFRRFADHSDSSSC
ncbi:hypothetical protein QR680_009750 [Steinernema hermaphroditum]|uniref:receptor protein-tyrosine kinase n=1 Tax=Steinernema hermaphroditum TaxID=289476 RepID=A0AA39ILJ2_9BILA|nr:hypothetical protein QR680_009750 [Steinernema hermaphroditum]